MKLLSNLLPRLYFALYNIILTAFIPVILLRLVMKCCKNPMYVTRLSERFGIFKTKLPQDTILLHSVSVGETVAAAPIIRELIARNPHTRILVTTTTPTGSQRLLSMFGDKVAHVFLPYDLPFVMYGFIKKVKPKLCIIMETELWPNLINSCFKQKAPIILANARLSNKSMQGYAKIKPLTKFMLDRIDCIASQAVQDADRFYKLGASKNSIAVMGNIKFDLPAIIEDFEKGQELKTEFNNRPVLIAASTHEKEEQLVLQAYNRVLRSFPNALLILVPRHPERFIDVEKLIQRNGLSFVKRSSRLPVTNNEQVLLGDTMGELNILYCAADVAFVGGSLVNIGGHNVLEPANARLPIIVGPHMHNFADITDKMQNSNALVRVGNFSELASAVMRLFSSSSQRSELGESAFSVLQQNKGAKENIMQVISHYLSIQV